MCHKCNQNNCGCSESHTHVNICTQCTEEQTCDCPIVDLSTDCVLYNQDDISCGDTVIVPKNTILSVALSMIVEWACTKFAELANYLSIINVGTGAEIYAGDNLLGKKKLRKINSLTDIITVTQNTDDISIDIDTDELDSFIEDNQLTYSVANISGIGADVYKDTTVVGDNTQFNLRPINLSSVGDGTPIIKDIQENTSNIEIRVKASISNTIMITEDGDDIRYELATADTPSFIVNSDYAGLEETGSIVKPFKNLQNALTAYQGSGTNLIPELVNDNIIIDIQKDVNVFVGNLAYDNLNLILRKGVTLNTTPAFGEHFLDVDSDAILPPSMSAVSDSTPFTITITLEEGSDIVSTKKGIKNRGTNLNTGGTTAKVINLLGDGNITIEDDVSVVSASIRNILDINSDNQVGFFNDGSLAHINLQCNLYSNNTQIYNVGLNGKLNIRNNTISFGNGTVDFNALTKPWENNGGIIDSDNMDYLNLKKGVVYTSVLHTMSNTASFYATNSNLGRECDYLFENVGSTQPFLSFNNCTDASVINTSIAKSTSVLWQNNNINGCNINGSINDVEFKILPSVLNIINGEVVETLSTYTSRLDAMSSGLFTGCKFINQTDLPVANVFPGREYEILTAGTTDFTLIGATDSVVGTKFKANTTSPLGTGTVRNYEIDVVI